MLNITKACLILVRKSFKPGKCDGGKRCDLVRWQIMARKIGIYLAIVLLALIVLLSIERVQHRTARPAPEALPSPPDFTGWVMAVDPGSRQIHVESQADKIVRPVTVKLTRDTLIFRREAGVLKQIDICEIQRKDQAELWLIGPAPSSFPAEVNARQVIVDRLY